MDFETLPIGKVTEGDVDPSALIVPSAEFQRGFHWSEYGCASEAEALLDLEPPKVSLLTALYLGPYYA